MFKITYYWCALQLYFGGGFTIDKTSIGSRCLTNLFIAEVLVVFLFIWFIRCYSVLSWDKLVDWGKYAKAVFIIFDEPIHAILLMLTKFHFLSDLLAVENEGRVRYHHLQSHFTTFHDEINHLLIKVFTFIVCNQENTLNFLHDLITHLLAYHFIQYFPPIALVLLPEHIGDCKVYPLATRCF